MLLEINKYQFSDLFDNFNRSHNFTREARYQLFDYLDDNFPDYQVDVIAICCEYSEDTIEDIIDNYRIELVEVEGYNLQDFVIEYLQEHTSVVGITDHGIVYAQF